MAGINATVPMASKTAMPFAILRRLSEDDDVKLQGASFTRTKDPFFFVVSFFTRTLKLRPKTQSKGVNGLGYIKSGKTGRIRFRSSIRFSGHPRWKGS